MTNVTKFVFKLAIAIIFFNCCSVFAQFQIPEKPKFQTSLYDYIDLLNSTERTQLEQKLIRYSDSTSTQIVISIISSTEGEYINYLGAQWAEKWGIGQADKDNGILILLAKNDRKIGINTGKGIEHLLTDALSKRIIERDIIPYFKRGDYYSGLDNGLDSIFKVLSGEYVSNRPQGPSSFPFIILILLFIVFLIIVIAISKSRGGRGGGNRGNRSDNTSIWDAITLSNMGVGNYRSRSSGGFGGSSGGGFGSGGFGGGFGGGSFGGGGSSGSW